MRTLNARVFIVLFLLMLSFSLHSQNDTINVLPWVESFDTWLPAGWQVNGDWDWIHDDFNHCAKASFWSESSGYSELISPAVQLLYNSSLVFRWSHQYINAYPNDALHIYISTDGTSWQSIWSRSAASLNSGDGAATNSPGSFIQETIDLSGYTTNLVRLKFKAISGYGPDLFIDDVGITTNQLYDHDLLAVTVSGPSGTMVGLDTRYNLTIENIGLQIESQYQVRLNIDDRPVSTVWGYNIAHDETQTYTFVINPDSSFAGNHNIWGEILLSEDMDTLNNFTASMNINIDPESSGIYGYIHNTDGNPLEEVVVEINETGETGCSDNTGFYYIPDVPVGLYTIVARKFMYNNTDSYVSIVDARELAEKNLTLEDGGLIGGIVKNTNGFPLKGVTVTVDGESVRTDLRGRYTLSGIRDGSYDVHFRKQGYVDSSCTSVSVVSDLNSELNCNLFKYGTITFDIHNDATENGDYNIFLTGINHSYNYELHNGYAVIDTLENDIYRISVSKHGFEPFTIDSVLIDYNIEYGYEITLNEIRQAPENIEFEYDSSILSWTHASENSRYITGFRIDVNDGADVLHTDSTSVFMGDIVRLPETHFDIKVYAEYSSGLSDPAVFSIDIIGISDDNVQVFEDKLLGNYPNPFNPETVISFSLSEKQFVELSIYNMIGQKVKTLCKSDLTPGIHNIRWNGKDRSGKSTAAGVYFYRINSGKLNFTGKMILLK